MPAAKGLTKEQMVETQGLIEKLVKPSVDSIKKNVDDLKGDFDRKIAELKKGQKDNEKTLTDFKSKTYEHFQGIELSLQGIEFKHNWRTAVWVVVGAAAGSSGPKAFGAVFKFLGGL